MKKYCSPLTLYTGLVQTEYTQYINGSGKKAHGLNHLNKFERYNITKSQKKDLDKLKYDAYLIEKNRRRTVMTAMVCGKLVKTIVEIFLGISIIY